MQNLKQKLKENPVGANCVRPHFEGITKNNQKGITLIALIITIIVMLILVGVTINVALNGGLFQKAEEAKTGTQLAVDREELQIAVVSALNDDREIPNAAAIKNNLQEGWAVTPGTDGTSYICTSPNENVFTVDNKGNIKPGSTGNTNPPQQDLPEIGEVKNQNGEALQVGDFITYNNETWVVMYNDDTNGLQIISQNLKPCIEFVGIDEYNGYNRAIPLLHQECEKYMSTGAEYARVAGTSPTFYGDGDLTELDEYGMIDAPSLNDVIQDETAFNYLVGGGKLNLDNNCIIGVREKYYRNDIEDTSLVYTIVYFDISDQEFESMVLSKVNSSGEVALNMPVYDTYVEPITEISTTINYGIFPVMIMNKNIEITGGDGVDTPYTYTFNQQ